MPRGLVKSLQESFLLSSPPPSSNALDYISQFRERLHRANFFTRQSFSSTHTSMKLHLIVLPLRVSITQERKCWCYFLFQAPPSLLGSLAHTQECLSDTDYLIKTPRGSANPVSAMLTC